MFTKADASSAAAFVCFGRISDRLQFGLRGRWRFEHEEAAAGPEAVVQRMVL